MSSQSVVLDASAVLAFARREPGADRVGPLLRGGLISAVNYSEVLKKAIEHGGDADAAAGLVDRGGVRVVPFDEHQARVAASLWPAGRSLGLSMADRACLALGIATAGTVYTADRRMAEVGTPLDVVLIRGGH